MMYNSHAYRLLIVLVVFAVSAAASVEAAPIGYWRFEGGAAGTDITTAASEANSPAMDATPWTGNEVAPQYSTDVAGAYVYDPVAGTYVANSLSMLAPAGASTSDDSQLIVLGSDRSTGDDWTVEMFIKTPTSVSGTARIGNTDGNERWNLNVGTNYVQFRVDTATATDDVAIVTKYGDPTEDGEWHHIGCTVSYDSDADVTTIELFVDYASAGTATAVGQFDQYGDLRFGRSSGADGDDDWWFDEIRLSDGLLTSSQFLQTTSIPEPCTLGLVGLGVPALLMRRRK